MNKNKIMNLIGTGTAVGALLIIAALFSNGGFGNFATASQAGGNEPITLEVTSGEAEAALETQNAQLQEALTIMQEREAEYQAKLDEANNMLLNPEPAAAYGEGEEAYEEEEYEEEEDDDEEGEEYEAEEEEEEEHEHEHGEGEGEYSG